MVMEMYILYHLSLTLFTHAFYSRYLELSNAHIFKLAYIFLNVRNGMEFRQPSIVFLSIYILCTSRNKSLDRRNSEAIIANKTGPLHKRAQYRDISRL